MVGFEGFLVVFVWFLVFGLMFLVQVYCCSVYRSGHAEMWFGCEFSLVVLCLCVVWEVLLRRMQRRS